jgi:hypothetical protein
VKAFEAERRPRVTANEVEILAATDDTNPKLNGATAWVKVGELAAVLTVWN